MKIWLVDPSEIDDRRLQAAHKEYHILYNRIDSGGKWLGWEFPEHRRDLRLIHDQLHTEFYKRDKEFKCQGFNDRQIVRDLWLIQNNGQRKYSDPLNRPYYTSNYDRWTLVCRWQGQFKGRSATWVNTSIYENLCHKYNDQGGCLHDGRWLKSKGHEYCLLCKRVERIKIDSGYDIKPYSPWSRK